MDFPLETIVIRFLKLKDKKVRVSNWNFVSLYDAFIIISIHEFYLKAIWMLCKDVYKLDDLLICNFLIY